MTSRKPMASTKDSAMMVLSPAVGIVGGRMGARIVIVIVTATATAAAAVGKRGGGVLLERRMVVSIEFRGSVVIRMDCWVEKGEEAPC